MADERLSAAYVAIVLGGARFEDERLRLLRALMTAAEIEDVERRLAAEHIRSLPPLLDAGAPDLTGLPVIVALYVEHVRRGARPDDPRIAAMQNALTADELERAKAAIGELWLRAEPRPAKPN